MAERSLYKKIAIITGASSGIGRATALALAEAGACIALVGRNEHHLHEVAAAVRSLGGEAITLPADITRQDQVNLFVKKTLEQWGRVDILVSNAGQYIRAPVEEMSLGSLEQSMAVNFYGHVYAIQAVLPTMLHQKSGQILLVSSMDAKKGLPNDAPYVSAKFALSGFGEVLRQEVRGRGVAVTTIFPGRVDTPMIANLKVPWISAKVSPEVVANAIVSAAKRRPAEVILPFQARLLYLLNVVAPRLADTIVRVFRLEGWEK
jgi:NADP-dependent 3-hydroxy acid dehydrogenase YdfG